MHIVPRLLILASAAAASATPVDFSHQIVPILRERCTECHAGDKKKGGFSMNDRETFLKGGEDGAVVDLKDSAKSSLLEAIISTDPDKQMPPKGKRLSSDEVALMKSWIEGGLTWEPGFAFKKKAYEPPLKPRKVELPPAVAGRSNPVDRLVDAHLAKNKLTRPLPLSDAAFMRRVSLDLTGLLPDPEALGQFLADKSPNKRTRLVNSLLGNEIAYADHWLTFWNDLLRNDYTGTGFITKGRKQITKWLYESLLTNKPYDQFTRELIAPGPDSAGFSEGIKWRGEVSAGQTVPIQFSQSVCQTFLGINMKCASCHDSFVDRWKLDEAYGLAAVVSNKPLEVFRCDKPVGRAQNASWLFPELGQIDASKPQAEKQKQLAALMTHPENGRFTRTIVNRLWHRLMGHGIVHPVDAMQTEPWNSDLLDYLATDFADRGYDLKKTLALICESQIYQSTAQVVSKTTDDRGYVFQSPRAKRLTAEQFVDAVWQITGAAPAKPDADVVRATSGAAGNPPMVRAGLVKCDFLMSTLGRPNRDQIVSMRPNDLGTLEAIDLANGPILAKMLQTGAANILSVKWSNPSHMVSWLYRFALSREPDTAEAELALASLGGKINEQGVQDLLWAIIMQPEFQLNH